MSVEALAAQQDIASSMKMLSRSTLEHQAPCLVAHCMYPACSMRRRKRGTFAVGKSMSCALQQPAHNQTDISNRLGLLAGKGKLPPYNFDGGNFQIWRHTRPLPTICLYGLFRRRRLEQMPRVEREIRAHHHVASDYSCEASVLHIPNTILSFSRLCGG
jgi:hypothetical protein